MGKAEKVTVTSADVATLSTGELRAMLDQREQQDRAAREAARPLFEKLEAAKRAVAAYEKDVHDAQLQVKDAQEYVETVQRHSAETGLRLKELQAAQAEAEKELEAAIGKPAE